MEHMEPRVVVDTWVGFSAERCNQSGVDVVGKAIDRAAQGAAVVGLALFDPDIDDCGLIDQPGLDLDVLSGI